MKTSSLRKPDSSYIVPNMPDEWNQARQDLIRDLGPEETADEGQVRRMVAAKTMHKIEVEVGGILW